jgi:hypothetical protein
MPRKFQVFGAIWAPLQLTEISRTVAEEYRRIVYKNIRSATGKLVSDSSPPPPLDILFVSNTYRIFQLQIDNMADTVEPVEAETMTGEMWSDKKATLLAVVQAN